ncbi:Wzz/FepE/Etk N-terminal domain-containing protein [Robertmurraya korlensis]|uniref:YveK family protein n=1 Tax=Robertmurraya korlensis TaxID=519977 RepID=UPI00203AAE21|nr:Wzz/FepE/Etk N-terminal domain-containing protein [Robertmurraya korlensis]MCM3600546.1 Wzz/FepE/Etk N-terminal domain-containing protein [Robertmurraya korlensis]
MNETVNIVDLILVLKKRWKLIVFLTILAPFISSLIAIYFITPIYQGTTLILVNQKNSENQIDLSQLSDNIDLINTYGMIIKSPAILGKVKTNLDLSQSVDQLNKKVTINSQKDSQIFSLTVEDSDASQAVKIANAVSKTFQQEIKGIMNVDNVSILAEAELNENPVPVKPNLLFNIAIAFIIGLLGGTGIALLMELMDTTLKDDQDVIIHLGLPVLGSIQKTSKTYSGNTNVSGQTRSETFGS